MNNEYAIAYIFVDCISGKEEIIRKISRIDQIKEVMGIYGVHNIFVKIQTDSMDEMNNIDSNIKSINGIEWTVMLVSIA